MSPKKKEQWRWFVHGDTATNAVIASRYSSDEATYTMMVCADGVRRDLWELDRPFLDRLLMDRRNLNLRFEVYVDRGNRGRPALYDKGKIVASCEGLKASA